MGTIWMAITRMISARWPVNWVRARATAARNPMSRAASAVVPTTMRLLSLLPRKRGCSNALA